MVDETPNGSAASPSGQRFVGRGFGTLSLRSLDGAGLEPRPQVVSQREILRRGLPAVYQDSDFAMRFVGALEEVLDPTAAILDGLHHYVDADFAPRDMLMLLCAWMGVQADEAQDTPRLRESVRRSAELGRRRGTARGLELALALAFPDLPLRVEDLGGVGWPGGAEVRGGPPRFVVYCDQPLPDERQAEIARCIEREKPVQATFRLRVKARKGADA